MLPREIAHGACECCPGDGSRLPPLAGRRSELVAGTLAVSLWMIVPKCPACVAAHVAICTGLGLSLASANYLRWSVLGCGAVLLVYAVVARLLRITSGIDGQSEMNER